MGNPTDPTVPSTQPAVTPAFVTTSTHAAVAKKVGEMLFIACMVLTEALASLNDGLRIVSTTVLAQDLREDKSFADQISAIKLVATPAAGQAGHTSIANANQQKVSMQQVLQARLKAHQNQEQIDIQGATSLSTDMQQLASVITSLMQLLGQIISALIQMTR